MQTQQSETCTLDCVFSRSRDAWLLVTLGALKVTDDTVVQVVHVTSLLVKVGKEITLANEYTCSRHRARASDFYNNSTDAVNTPTYESS